MVLRFACLCLVVGLASAATYQGWTPKKPTELAHKEGCYVWEINDVIPFGATVHPIGYCYRIECGGEMMQYASCGVVSTEDSNCHKTEMDLSRPYPDCCPGIQCEEDNRV